jgi:hypothetical protein
MAISGIAVAAAVAGCSSGASGSGDVALAAGTPTTSTTTSESAPAPTSVSATSTPAKSSPANTQPAKPAVVPAAGVPCTTTASACVDLSAHKAWLLDAGKVTYGPVPIMPGKKGSTTPLGTFHVIGKEKLHLSKEFDNAPMPNSVFFYPGDAFHTGSLDNYSNGCVHLSSTASLRFFNTLSMGDEVQVVR